MSYVRLTSWHRISMTYRSGMVKTRCGRGPLGVIGAITSAGIVYPTSDSLPMGERSCETCLRLTTHDAEPPAVLGAPDAD